MHLHPRPTCGPFEAGNARFASAAHRGHAGDGGRPAQNGRLPPKTRGPAYAGEGGAGQAKPYQTPVPTGPGPVVCVPAPVEVAVGGGKGGGEGAKGEGQGVF